MTKTRDAYWRRQLRLTIILLVIWAIFGFGLSILGAEWLNTFAIGGIPLGFWTAQQGSIFVFVLLILAYALLMDRAELAAGLRETDETTSNAGADH